MVKLSHIQSCLVLSPAAYRQQLNLETVDQGVKFPHPIGMENWTWDSGPFLKPIFKIAIHSLSLLHVGLPIASEHIDILSPGTSLN